MRGKVEQIIKDFANLQISVSKWITNKRRDSDLKVNPIQFSDCKQWEFSEGALKHNTGRYFSIRGFRIECNVPHLNGLEHPMIDQPEIGILGFVVRQNHTGWEWLLQAKAEPGNVFGVQVGPSVQATKSNYECVHQGRPTPLIECFTAPDHPGVTLLTDVEQSEQGDRFLSKYNRNCVAEVSFDYPVPDSNVLKWFPASALRKVLLSDYMLNTDVRSVLFCSNWKLLADEFGEPFGRWEDKGGFGEQLLHSYLCKTSKFQTIDSCIEKIEAVRESTIINRSLIPLSELSNWKIRSDRINERNIKSSFSIRAYDVFTSDREVWHWCQPLLESNRKVEIAIICTSVADVLYFFLRLSPEPGYQEVFQLAPSWINDPLHFVPDWIEDALYDRKSICRAHMQQSDEGGRFINSIVSYNIIEVSPKWIDFSKNNGFWLTLGQLKRLAKMKGYLTNESRSTLSMLLYWL